MVSPDKQFLEVPYSEKDRAKQFGARWDPMAKKWYVPAGLDVGLFSAWMPGTMATGSREEPNEGLIQGLKSESIGLGYLLQKVGIVIAQNLDRSQWVRAEISQLRPISGRHLALELVEHDEQGRLTARLSAFAWNQRAEPLLQKFHQETGAELTAGIKVMLQLSLEYNPTYGLRALIEDIDPSFTLGDIARKLRKIRETLEAKGLMGLNRALPRPTEFLHVAVISPRDAAGLGDFRQDADHLEAHQLCRFSYFPATFQGPDAAASLIETLGEVLRTLKGGTTFDAVCLIRGGGSVTDLYWLNDLALSETLCQLPVPVFTGIGHERDNTILDEIANQRFDTPSKVIGHISGTLYANANQAVENLLSILKLSERQLQLFDQSIERLSQDIKALAHATLIEQEFAIETQWRKVKVECDNQINNTETGVSRLMDDFRKNSRLILETASLSVRHLMDQTLELGRFRIEAAERTTEAYAREILGLGPAATLARGFALAKSADGQPITSRQEALNHPDFDLAFHDGDVAVSLNPPHEP